MAYTNLISSWEFNSSPYMYVTIKYEASRDGVDVKYRFNWRVWIKSTSTYGYALELRLHLNGVNHTVSVKGASPSSGWDYSGTTGWYTISNKTSGTVPFYIDFRNATTTTVYGASSTYNLSVPACMAFITKAPNFSDEENPVLEYSNPLGDNAQEVKACISLTGSTDDIVYRTISKSGTSYTFNLTSSERTTLRNACKNAKSMTVYFYIRTKSSDTYFYSSKSVTMTIVNGEPTFTASNITQYKDTNTSVVAVTGDNTIIVAGKSNLKVYFTQATPKKNADIVSYQFKFNGVTKTQSSSPVDFGIVTASTTQKLTVTVTDSRGYTKTVEKNITCVGYEAPSADIRVARVNNYEDETHFTVDAHYSEIGNNELTIEYQKTWKGYTYPSWGGGVIAFKTVDDNNVTVESGVDCMVNCQNDHEWEFIFVLTDSFGTSVTYDAKQGLAYLTIQKGIFPLFIDTELNSVGINAFPKEGEALRIGGGEVYLEDEAIKDYLSSVSLTSCNLNSNANEAFRLLGRICVLNLGLTMTTSISANSATEVAKLPSDLIPSANKIVSATCLVSNQHKEITGFIRGNSQSTASNRGQIVITSPVSLASGASIGIFAVFKI